MPWIACRSGEEKGAPAAPPPPPDAGASGAAQDAAPEPSESPTPHAEEQGGPEAQEGSPLASERHFDNDRFDLEREREQAALDAPVEAAEGAPRSCITRCILHVHVLRCWHKCVQLRRRACSWLCQNREGHTAATGDFYIDELAMQSRDAEQPEQPAPAPEEEPASAPAEAAPKAAPPPLPPPQPTLLSKVAPTSYEEVCSASVRMAAYSPEQQARSWHACDG